MRALSRWAALLVTIVACVASATAAYQLAGYSWDQVVNYRTPYVAGDLPAARSGPALADRVVLVIVDGLGESTSRSVTGIQALRGYGADFVAVAPQPSLSYPNWTTLLSGAPQAVSGVTTNWYEGAVRVETLIDTSLLAGRSVVVVGPESFETLYGARRATAHYLKDWKEGEYLSGELVTQALALAEDVNASLLIVHLPDVDEAGHDYGRDSEEYAKTAERVDADVSRLVAGLQDDRTIFIVTADHGHLAAGGHGGWEEDVTRVPAVFAGPGIAVRRGAMRMEDVAPTVAALAGIPTPRHATGEVVERVFQSPQRAMLDPGWAQRRAMAREYVSVVYAGTSVKRQTPQFTKDSHGTEVDAVMNAADGRRLAEERNARFPVALAVVAVFGAGCVAIGLASWRALVSAGVGTAVYYAVYNGLYFGVHGYRWSLSAFNSEDMVRAFFNARMLEASLAGLLAALAAGVLYPLLRRVPRGARGKHLAGWLTLGPATVFVVMSSLALQVAWYLWWWGAQVTWKIPDLMWGFKYDLDLVQATALGAAAIASPLVTLLVGRYHPRVRLAEATPPPSESQTDVRTAPAEE